VPALLEAIRAEVEHRTPATPAPEWVPLVARDLARHPGRGVVIVGGASPAMRASADAINVAIGAVGRTTWHAPSPLIGGSVRIRPFSQLLVALRSHAVDTLVIVGGNPSYTTPSTLGLSSLIRSVPNAGYVGLYENETARDVKWFVPQSHYLESWGDARAYDGTVSIVQPLINPLYESITTPELYAALAGAPVGRGAYEVLRTSWSKRAGANANEVWSDALRRGVVAGTAFTPVSSPHPSLPLVADPASTPTGTVDVVYSGDAKVHDGAFANNGWLQELPSPLTQLAWGNAAVLSETTANRIGAQSGDVLTLSAGERHLAIPALVVPGHADDTITLQFGYGRAGSEAVARGIGTNVYPFWPAIDVRSESGVSVSRRAGATATPPLAIVQTHATMEASRPVRSATLAEYRASPSSVGERSGRVLSLYPAPEPPVGLHGPNQWAMTIDLATCIGCGACVVACQAENNVPVVGADQVRRGRDMHWIRIDRYFAEREAEVDALLQPMLCQHCEKAPCEYVCPVGATVHSADGLNEMVYNRCVGTRFCSNNCPYKVRRFNWFDYNAHLSETEMMVKNPNVTVRGRGVMEKCTFCVQRIREAEIAAGREGREVRGDDVRTACQQACPTNAIVFGSLTDPESEMVRRREQPRSYSVLHELGTEPRVRYLARVRNTNPEIHGQT
jgi:molybdopterin-containing oxidoreductase family iron-sulfur binding subunit